MTQDQQEFLNETFLGKEGRKIKKVRIFFDEMLGMGGVGDFLEIDFDDGTKQTMVMDAGRGDYYANLKYIFKKIKEASDD